MARRSYAGGAVSTTITGSISPTDLSVTIADATGWPSTASGEAVATIGRGTASEEKVLFTRSGTTLTFANTGKRGVDGTSAASHASGASIEHTMSALDVDEANAHVNTSTDVHGLAGGAAVVGTTTTQTLTNKTLTAPTIADFTNAAHDHGDADDGGLVVTARGRIGSGIATSASASFGSATMVGSSTGVITLVAGRRYKITIFGAITTSTATGGTIRLHDGGAGSPSTSSEQFLQTPFQFVSGSTSTSIYAVTELTCVASGASGLQINAGSHNFQLAGTSSGGNSNFYVNTDPVDGGAVTPYGVIVEDIGT